MNSGNEKEKKDSNILNIYEKRWKDSAITEEILFMTEKMKMLSKIK